MTNKYINKFFGDAKTSGIRIWCIISALFWTTIIYFVLRIWIAAAFGLYHAQYNKYPEALLTIAQSQPVTAILIWLITLIVFVKLVPFYEKKDKDTLLYVEVVNPIELKQPPQTINPIQKQPQVVEPATDDVNRDKILEVIEKENNKKIEPQIKIETYEPGVVDNE